jgi:hypothetical protein
MFPALILALAAWTTRSGASALRWVRACFKSGVLEGRTYAGYFKAAADNKSLLDFLGR